MPKNGSISVGRRWAWVGVDGERVGQQGRKGKESGQRWLKMEENGVKWGSSQYFARGERKSAGFSVTGGGGIRVSRYP